VVQKAGIELIILRPPLVYGPGVKANFRALIRLAANGLPLPFSGIYNRIGS
jgi:nucleoside-diphosphate-sugar epimerase